MASIVTAECLTRAWRRADIKLNLDGQMHVLRWRRGPFADEVLFDERCVARSTGLFGRETIYGLAPIAESGEEIRLLLTIDPELDWSDWSGATRIRGVRLETASEVLVAEGSFGPSPVDRFGEFFDRAVKAMGL
ncbi:MAG: hypothetical protein ACFB00_01665 [Parvularculaceae bacterium]